jgi:hypothetical protein
MEASDSLAIGLLVLSSGLVSCRGRADRPADAGIPATRVPSAAASATRQPEVFQVGGDVSAPRLLNRAEPLIPPGCMHRQVRSGLGIYEAVITESGDVDNVRTLKAPIFSPPCPEAEVEARRAISQ